MSKMPLRVAETAIRSHGHDCYRTPEGLLAITTQVWAADAVTAGRAPCAMDDRACDSETTFPVDAMGDVDRDAVRAWLGY